MACNAKATTSATLVNVQLEKDQLTQLAAQLFQVEPTAIRFHDYGYSWQFDVMTNNGLLALEQFKDASKGMRIGATNPDQAAQLDAQLQRLAVPYQQSAVLKKLAALGKLSDLQQKDSGITARLEITL